MPTIVIKITHRVFSTEEAKQLTAKLNQEDEDGWSYEVENNPNPNGPKTAIVKVYDENNNLVGLL